MPTRNFSLIMSACARANIKLVELGVQYHAIVHKPMGIPVSALNLPRATLASLSNLSRLELLLTTVKDIRGKQG